MQIQKKLFSLLSFLIITLLILSCSNNQAKVSIECIGDPIKAGVNGDYRYINSNDRYTWTITWSSNIFGPSTKEVELYAEDTEYPNLYNARETVTLSNNRHYVWYIGWTSYNSLSPAQKFLNKNYK